MIASIIVPLYKVEDYLEKCVGSLLAQDIPHNDYEIILINDGSPDGTAGVARKLASEHHNIIFVDQQNQGVSVARNAGLDVAQGKYILFVDPDDWIRANSLSGIFDTAQKGELDMLYLCLDKFDEQGNFLGHVDDCGQAGLIVDGFAHPRRTFLPTMYRRALIGQIRFTPGIIRGQDTVFNVMVQARASRVSYFPDPYYCYLIRSSSSRTVQASPEVFASCLLAIDTIDDFRRSNFPDQSALQKSYFDNAILIFIQRTMEWNVLPGRNRHNFDTLKAHLRRRGLGHLITLQAMRMASFHRPFTVFMLNQRLVGYWDALKYKLKRR